MISLCNQLVKWPPEKLAAHKLGAVAGVLVEGC